MIQPNIIINRATLRLFANIVTELNIATEELEKLNIATEELEKLNIATEELEIPLTVLEFKKLWILSGKSKFFDRWIYDLYKNHLYIDNISCYKYLQNKFVPLFNYLLFGEYDNKLIDLELRDLQQFIKTTYPFDIISTKELTDINKIEKELVKYCQIYMPILETLPEIEKIKIQSMVEIIDDLLLTALTGAIYDLSSKIIEKREEMIDPSREDPSQSQQYLERMADDIGEANYTILLIDIFKNEGYHIKDYISEGRELVINLNNAVIIKLDKRLADRFWIKKYIDLSHLDAMKKFVEETFPLNKIATREIDFGYRKIILKDFLKGITIIPKPWMFKKIIRLSDLETLKVSIEKVLKENQDANIYIHLTREDIESILESNESIPRLYIKDINRHIVYTTDSNLSITYNFDILLILSNRRFPVKSMATKRILLDADIESYKYTLRDIIITNPNAIIGDIIFKNGSCEDLRNIVDNIPTDIELFHIDILQKDQDIIKELYKKVDITKFKEGEPILKATIGGIEISETFPPETFCSILRQTLGHEKNFRILTFHINKVTKYTENCIL